jgi:chromosome segregation ATPase
MTVDPDDLREALTIYHREVLLPDMNRMFNTAETPLTKGFDGFDGHFAEMHRRFDRLDALSQEALATIRRIETKLDSVETRLDRIETKLDSVETKLDRLS